MAMNVKVSRFRQTKASLAKSDTHMLNVQPTSAIWDCANFLAANSKYIAVPWSTVGSTLVVPHNTHGKLPPTPPMLSGHSGNVIDVVFHPFDDAILFTGSEDCTVKVWKIPETDPVSSSVAPHTTLAGHGKKVGVLVPHPSATNVLATAGSDNIINMWDIEMGKPRATIKTFDDAILSVNWNMDGSLLNTTTKDRRVSIVDSRSGALVSSAEAHAGSKTHRSVWAKRRNLIVTAGFNKQQFRQLMVWDPREMTKPLHVEEIDQQSSVFMPFMDEDTNMLYLGGKGDGSIKYYELWDEATPITALSSYTSNDPQKGLCMLPKRCMNVKSCEVARFYKLASNTKSVQAISFVLPRKTAELEFQEDVYPPTFGPTPALTAEQYFSGKNAFPNELSLKGLFDETECATIYSPASPDSPPPRDAFERSNQGEAESIPPARTETKAPVTEQVEAKAQLTMDGSDDIRAQEAVVAYLREQLRAAEARLSELRQN